jgi:hypothetical protein
MTRKEIKKRIREEVAADQARYDDVTRRMLGRIDYHKARAEARERGQGERRRESS